jgi:hypothetical protein
MKQRTDAHWDQLERDLQTAIQQREEYRTRAYEAELKAEGLRQSLERENAELRQRIEDAGLDPYRDWNDGKRPLRKL